MFIKNKNIKKNVNKKNTKVGKKKKTKTKKKYIFLASKSTTKSNY